MISIRYNFEYKGNQLRVQKTRAGRSRAAPVILIVRGLSFSNVLNCMSDLPPIPKIQIEDYPELPFETFKVELDNLLTAMGNKIEREWPDQYKDARDVKLTTMIGFTNHCRQLHITIGQDLSQEVMPSLIPIRNKLGRYL